MTVEELEEIFEKHGDEFLTFDKVEGKRSNRTDLHAFLLLDELVPSERGCDIVSGARHDEIWIDTDVSKLAKVATEDQIIELIRCGIRYSEDSLAMFV